MTDKRRKQRIEQVRAEAREAFDAGKHVNPYGATADAMHWRDAWEERRAEVRAQDQAHAARALEVEAELARLQLASAILEYVSHPNEFAVQQMLKRLKEFEDHIVQRVTQELNHGN